MENCTSFKETLEAIGIYSFDMYEATVTGLNSKGCYLTLNGFTYSDGRPVTTFCFGSFNVGDILMVSVGRINEERRCFRAIPDYVISYAFDTYYGSNNTYGHKKAA